MDIVTLISTLVNALEEVSDRFYHNPKDLYGLETRTKIATDQLAASFMSMLISGIDAGICEDEWRKMNYNILRHDTRTLITSVGDVVFKSTYFESLDAPHRYRHLVEDIIGLAPHERFSEAAEVAMLNEAAKSSYEEAAKVIPSQSRITKTTVMHKVHEIAKEIPMNLPDEKRKCPVLFIEADEDHVAEQHGRWKKDNKGFISRLAYIYECKRDNPKVKGKRELVNTVYFSGLYEGREGIEKFWKKISDYIDCAYDPDELKRVYISGDGATWIKNGTDHIPFSLYCVDKFHMTKYIHAAANQMLDQADEAKEELYRLIYKDRRKDFQAYTDQMAASANNPDSIYQLQSYALGNWSAVMRSYRDKDIPGCSAEGHVSSILSARLSSRPMGWSRTGADRMSKLRCYQKNQGSMIELVRLSRQKRKLARTGTDDDEVSHVTLREIHAEHYDQARSYIDRIQATIPGWTARKSFSIREQIRLC